MIQQLVNNHDYLIQLGVIIGLAVNIFGIVLLGFKIGKPFGEMVSSIKKIEQDFVRLDSTFTKFLNKYDKDNGELWEQINESRVEIAKLSL